jgi:hypothetical protein
MAIAGLLSNKALTLLAVLGLCLGGRGNNCREHQGVMHNKVNNLELQSSCCHPLNPLPTTLPSPGTDDVNLQLSSAAYQCNPSDIRTACEHAAWRVVDWLGHCLTVRTAEANTVLHPGPWLGRAGVANDKPRGPTELVSTGA